MRAVRQAVLAVAVVTGVAAALRRRPAPEEPEGPGLAVPAECGGAVPAQRRSGLDELGLQVDDLVLGEHAARDERLWAALERPSRSPGC